MSKATGTSMQGNIIYTRQKGMKPVPCNCSKCSYRKAKGEIKYCTYYDIFSPDKKTCLRYCGPAVKITTSNSKPKKKKKRSAQELAKRRKLKQERREIKRAAKAAEKETAGKFR